MSPEQVAEQLGISRAALYNYEKGEGPVKLETLERIAELLKTSLPSILGVGTEYFSSAMAYFERLRQIEAASERVDERYIEGKAARMDGRIGQLRLQQGVLDFDGAA